MSRLSYVNGDATKPQQIANDSLCIVPHIVNDLGLWGSGFVIGINSTFGDKPMKSYNNWYNGVSPDDTKVLNACPFELGQVMYYNIGNNSNIIIANMIAQHDISSKSISIDYIDEVIDRTVNPIRYGALSKAMYNVLKFVKNIVLVENTEVEIHCPKFGSLRSGGDWDVIEQMILEIWVKNNINVVVYQFKEG